MLRRNQVYGNQPKSIILDPPHRTNKGYESYATHVFSRTALTGANVNALTWVNRAFQADNFQICQRRIF